MTWRDVLTGALPRSDDKSDTSTTSVTTVTSPVIPRNTGERANRVPAQARLMPAAEKISVVIAAEQRGAPWAEWKAGALNRLFQEYGTSGEPGKITASTIEHGATAQRVKR